MKQFLDFLPLVVFFAFYKIYDIYAATAALIVATAIVLIYSWVRFRKVEKMALITFVLVVVFGGLTLFFHNDEFIKWKVTVIYALFAGAANELTSALIVNPYDRDEVAAALDRALTMSLAERISRHAEMLDVIVKNDINHWQECFISDLKQIDFLSLKDS